jgi:hypothetical protein
MVAAAGRVLAFLALLAIPEFAQAQVQAASEAAVKAAFLFKFAGYVEWPVEPPPDLPFVIGVVSSDEVATELERLAPGRAIRGRPVVVRRLKEGESFKDLHMLFVGRAQPVAGAIVRSAREQGVLTVTESDRGLDLGSVVNFVPVEDRVGFEVSLDAADKGGHRISSRMLAVARKVVPKS